jgi:aconitate hydratase 2/2-methylisocitrate dehydratase
VGAILGRLPTPEEYLKFASDLDAMSDEIYRYMNFDQIVEFQKSAEEGSRIAAVEIQQVSA